MTANPFQLRREQLSKTKEGIAREIGVSTTMVWGWEHDRSVPRGSRFEALLSAYETDAATLRGWMSEQAARVQARRLEHATTD